MKRQFDGSVVVVTGATSGIGLATARAFRDQGARVVGTGRDQARLAALGREIDLALTCDVTSEVDVRTLAAVVEDRYGAPDVLVSNAGIGLFASWSETSEADLERVLAVDLVGAVRVARALLPGMVAKGSGVLVQVASVAGKRGYERQTAYCAAKHGLVGWSEALRLELVGTGVHVCVVCPPAVRTPFFARAGWPTWEQDSPHVSPLDPAFVAGEILQATARRERERIPSGRARLLYGLSRRSPRLLEAIRRLRHVTPPGLRRREGRG